MEGRARGGGVGGLWKSLRFERLLFLITARLFLKWIKHGNLAHAHTHIAHPTLREKPVYRTGCANLRPLPGPSVQSRSDL